MRKCLFILALLGVAGQAQEIPVWLPATPTVRAHYVWLTFGSGLAIQDGKLACIVPQPARVIDYALVRDAGGGYKLPGGARNLTLYVNGIRYRAVGNWTVKDGVLYPSADNWPTDAEVLIDYDP